jgi:acyl-CoA synthetase (AMP-forming)/AMP-acid ligase II/thioesterase domain-containing protein/aryl carrier-like protein
MRIARLPERPSARWPHSWYVRGQMAVQTPAFSLLAHLEQRALTDPCAPAILAPSCRPLSYGNWYAIALEARAVMREAGIDGRHRLGIVLPNGPLAATALIALSGPAPLVPLDPASRVDEIERTFAALGVTAVVVPSEGGDAARAAAQRLGLLRFEACATGDAAGAFSLRTDGYVAGAAVDVEPNDVAVIGRTSGTTGEPKQVAVGARQLLAGAEACARAFALGPNDRCIFAQPSVHSAALVTLMAVLLARSSIVCLEQLEADAILASLRDGATWLSAPPALYRQLLERVPTDSEVLLNARLRFLRAGSTALAHDLCLRLEDAFAAPVLQCYGMTEAPFISCTPFPPMPRKFDSVGFPRGCEVAIVDASGKNVDPETVGEVLVRGPNAIIEGWMPTGDVGRLDADGYLYLLGRRKELINRGGQKIMPSEVEDVLAGNLAVREVAVFAIPHPTLGEEVAAAVVVRDGMQRTEDDLRAFAAERLTLAKVPKRILILPQLPRTATGKVQRYRLQALLAERRPSRAPGEGRAVTTLEAILVELFASVLPDQDVRTTDDFFLCGGDSLRAMQVIADVRDRCGLELTVEMLFRAPTPEALARVLHAALPRSSTPLRCVQQGTKTVPLFFLDGDLERGGVYMRQLARELDPERTVYSLPPHGTNGIVWHDTIETMASHYADVLEAAFPDGPFLLGGYCNGGIVAFEVARALRARGATVGPLVLVAATASNAPFAWLRRTVAFAAPIFALNAQHEHAWYLRLRSHAIALATLRRQPQAAYERYVLEFGRVIRRLRAAPPLEEPPEEAESPAYVRMGEAMGRYFPRRYDGEVHHLWGEADAPRLPADPSMGWRYLAPRLTLHRVPGDHVTIVTRATHVGAVVRPLLEPYA